MDRKTRGTVAVFIIAAVVIVAGVVNRYFVSNVGAGSETNEQQTASPTDESEITQSETATPTDLTEFRAVINEVQELDVLVPVNVGDGLTRDEAEQIAEATFVQVKGEGVMHRLDSLMLDDNSMEAHYTWGLDENDMGHFFDITVDIASRLITVTHCF